MRVNRDTAAVIGDGDGIIGIHLNFDTVGIASNGFIHGVIQNFGNKMVKCLSIRSANIHTGAGTNGLKPFQDLNVLCRISFLFRCCAFK